MMKSLREITYEYAQARGGGLPLTAEELCNCVVQWVQQYTKEQISSSGEVLNKIRTATYEAISTQFPVKLRKQEADESEYNLVGMDISLDVQQLFLELMSLLEATDLIGYFEGSDTIVVDLNEANDKIEIHLDNEIIQKIDKIDSAVLKPHLAPIEPKLPVLGVDNAVTWEPVSSFTGGGGGGYLFRISGPNGSFNINLPVEVPSSYAGLKDFLVRNNIYDTNSSFIPCGGRTNTAEFPFGCTLNSNSNILMKAIKVANGSITFTIINIGETGSFTCIKLM